MCGKLFTWPLILKDRFAERRYLGCRTSVFIIFGISCQSLMAFKVSVSNSSDSFMGPSEVPDYFLLGAMSPNLSRLALCSRCPVGFNEAVSLVT